MLRNAQTLVTLAMAFFLHAAAVAAPTAFDSAADPEYDNGWQTGDNGGYGFGPWVLNNGFGCGSTPLSSMSAARAAQAAAH